MPTDARVGRLLGGGGLLLLAFGASISLGSVRIPAGDMLAILTGGEMAQPALRDIVFLIRLPKALTAVLVGSALAVAGLQMQTLFLNPLAGPFVLGINAGASLGVALIVLLGGPALLVLDGTLGFLHQVGTVGAAFMGAGTVLVLVLVLARRVSVVTLVILGLMVSYIVSALVSLLMYFSFPERLQAFLAWSYGSFGGVTWPELAVMTPVVLFGLLLSVGTIRPLNALLLGEEYALSLGIPVRHMRLVLLLCASLLAGTVTAYAGPISFIGIAIPHLGRALLRTSDHLVLVPACLLLGSAVALIADLIAQLPGIQTILPLNAVTSLFGAPVVIWALLRRQAVQSPFTQ